MSRKPPPTNGFKKGHRMTSHAPPTPASNPDTDINPAAWRTDLLKPVRILRLKSHVTRWGQRNRLLSTTDVSPRNDSARAPGYYPYKLSLKMSPS